MGKNKRRLDIEGDPEEESRPAQAQEREEGAEPEEKAPEWEISEEEIAEAEAREAEEAEGAAGPLAALDEQLRQLNDKYIRLYAEYENYRKKTAKDKEDLARYAREEVLYDLLPSLDHLEIALRHASENEAAGGLRQGVEMTLREILRTLEKFGLKTIEAKGKPFDPEYHHAISQVETDEVGDKTVVEEFRKGYMLGDKVLRASMVAVARRPAEAVAKEEAQKTEETEETVNIETKEE